MPNAAIATLLILPANNWVKNDFIFCIDSIPIKISQEILFILSNTSIVCKNICIKKLSSNGNVFDFRKILIPVWLPG